MLSWHESIRYEKSHVKKTNRIYMENGHTWKCVKHTVTWIIHTWIVWFLTHEFVWVYFRPLSAVKVFMEQTVLLVLVVSVPHAPLMARYEIHTHMHTHCMLLSENLTSEYRCRYTHSSSLPSAVSVFGRYRWQRHVSVSAQLQRVAMSVLRRPQQIRPFLQPK